MRINKYKLYLLCTIISLLCFFYKDLPLLYDSTLVDAVHIEDRMLIRTGGRSYNTAYNYYMKFNYDYGDWRYTYIPPTFLNWDLLKTWDKKLIIQKSNPEHAHIHTFLGMYMETLIYFLPFLLLLSIAFLVNGIIPKRISFKKRVDNNKYPII